MEKELESQHFFDQNEIKSKKMISFSKIWQVLINPSSKSFSAEKIESKKLKEIELDLQSKVSTLLNQDLNDVKEIFVEYLNAGYKLTNEQTTKFHLFLLSDKLSLNEFAFYFNFIDIEKLNLNDNFLCDAFWKYCEVTKLDLHDFKNSHLYQIYETTKQNKNFSHLFFQKWNKKIELLFSFFTEDYYSKSKNDDEKSYHISGENSDSIIATFQHIYIPLKNKEYFFLEPTHFSQILNYFKNLKQYSNFRYGKDGFTLTNDYLEKEKINFNFKLTIQSFSELINNFKELEIENTKEKIKQVYGRKDIHLSQLVLDIAKEKLKINNLNELPIEIINLVNKIESSYSLIFKQQQILEITEQLQLDKLRNERLPKILNDYLKLDEDYKNTMVNSQGKNSLTLMKESLTSILNKFEELREKINESHMRELSVSHRYTKKM